jgi:hypothetical protein
MSVSEQARTVPVRDEITNAAQTARSLLASAHPDGTASFSFAVVTRTGPQTVNFSQSIFISKNLWIINGHYFVCLPFLVAYYAAR